MLRSIKWVGRYISFLVLYLLTCELSQRVVHWIPCNNIYYFAILFIGTQTSFTLLTVVKKISNLDCCTLLCGDCLRLLSQSPILEDSCIAYVWRCCFASDCKVADIGYTSKSFTSESKAGDLTKITELNNFTGSEPFTKYWEVFELNAMSIVLNL